MSKSKIEWTEQSWNPIIGCSKVSPGCANCYAETMARRLKAMGKPAYRDAINSKGHWTGQVILVPEKLDEPLKRKRPTTYFVNSMSDLFHETLAWTDIERIFMVMIHAQQHTFQVLTKHPHIMAEFVSACFPGLAECSPHIWLGTSVENQKTANERIPYLLQTPAAIHFLSCEPLLGPVDIAKYFLKCEFCEEHGRLIDPKCPPRDGICYRRRWSPKAIHWVIVGGESGPNARPIHPDWVRSLRDQCQEAEIPFFFKQWGEWLPRNQVIDWSDIPYNAPEYIWPNGWTSYRIGKKAAGRLLDGKEWNEFPK